MTFLTIIPASRNLDRSSKDISNSRAFYPAVGLLLGLLLLGVEEGSSRFFSEQLTAAFLVAVIAWFLLGNAQKMPQTTLQWGILVFLGVVASGIGYFMWNYGATQVDAGTLGKGDWYFLAMHLRDLCDSAGAALLIAGHPDVAVAVGADGVHLAPHDMPLAAARKVLEPWQIAGVAGGSVDDCQTAYETGADYVTVDDVRRDNPRWHEQDSSSRRSRHARSAGGRSPRPTRRTRTGMRAPRLLPCASRPISSAPTPPSSRSSPETSPPRSAATRTSRCRSSRTPATPLTGTAPTKPSASCSQPSDGSRMRRAFAQLPTAGRSGARR